MAGTTTVNLRGTIQTSLPAVETTQIQSHFIIAGDFAASVNVYAVGSNLFFYAPLATGVDTEIFTQLPGMADWNLTNVDIVLYWMTDVLGGDVRFSAKAGSQPDGTLGSTALGTAVAVTDAATAADTVYQTTLTDVTPSGTATEDSIITLAVSRLGADAADTNTGEVKLIGAKVIFNI